jgi:predicted ATP-grasp superfamily ATP-dependent carboligase
MPTIGGAIGALYSAVSVEQIFSRSLAAVLIAREIARSPDPEAELRLLTGEIHRVIDRYGIDRPTPEHHLEKDKEAARLVVDAVVQIVSLLRTQPDR